MKTFPSVKSLGIILFFLLLSLSGILTGFTFRTLINLHDKHLAAISTRAEWKHLESILLKSILMPVVPSYQDPEKTLEAWDQTTKRIIELLGKLSRYTLNSPGGSEEEELVASVLNLWKETGKSREEIRLQLKALIVEDMGERIEAHSIAKVFYIRELNLHLDAWELALLGKYINAAALLDANTTAFEKEIEIMADTISNRSAAAIRRSLTFLFLLYLLLVILFLLSIRFFRRLNHLEEENRRRRFLKKNQQLLEDFLNSHHLEEYFFMAVFRFDRDERFEKEFDLYKVQTGLGLLSNNLEKLFSTNTPHLIQYSDTEAMLLFPFDQEKKELQFKLIEAMLRNRHSNIEEDLSYSISIALFTAPVLLKNVNDSRLILENHLEKVFLEGFRSFFRVDDSEEEEREISYPAEQEHRFLSLLRMGKLDSAMLVLDEMIKIASEQSPFSVKSTLYTVISQTGRTIQSLCRINRNRRAEEYVSKILELIREPTKNKIRSKLESYLRSCFHELETDSGGGENELVEQVNNLIQKLYEDPGLSLSIIADKLGYSPEYLGRIYRRIEGYSISWKLNNFRMTEMKLRLSKGEKSISDVARSVGITNEKYVFTLFKKNFGISPGDYRKKIKEGKGAD